MLSHGLRMRNCKMLVGMSTMMKNSKLLSLEYNAGGDMTHIDEEQEKRNKTDCVRRDNFYKLLGNKIHVKSWFKDEKLQNARWDEHDDEEQQITVTRIQCRRGHDPN